MNKEPRTTEEVIEFIAGCDEISFVNRAYMIMGACEAAGIPHEDNEYWQIMVSNHITLMQMED